MIIDPKGTCKTFGRFCMDVNTFSFFFSRKSLVHEQYSSDIKRNLDRQCEKKTRSSQKTDLNSSRRQIMSKSPAGPAASSGASATILSNPTTGPESFPRAKTPVFKEYVQEFNEHQPAWTNSPGKKKATN